MRDNYGQQQKIEEILKLEYALLPKYIFKELKNIGLSLEEGYIFLELWYLIITEKIKVSESILAERVGIDEDKVLGLLANLISKRLVSFREENGILYYCVLPFIENITNIEEDGALREDKVEAEIYQVFAGEFKRTLSPIEVDFIDEWLNEKFYSQKMIIEVLKLAVTGGKLNFKYIDKVLVDWDKKGISSQEENEKIARENKLNKKPGKKSLPKTKATAKPGKYDDLYE